MGPYAIAGAVVITPVGCAVGYMAAINAGKGEQAGSGACAGVDFGGSCDCGEATVPLACLGLIAAALGSVGLVGGYGIGKAVQACGCVTPMRDVQAAESLLQHSHPCGEPK